MARERELFDMAAEVRRETDRAVLLFDGAREGWVPKALVEDNGDGTFTLPVWKAKELGFV